MDVEVKLMFETTPVEEEDPLLRVDVYYEVLCPDTRFFVLQHLLPTHEKVGSLLDIHLWPYGKATTKVKITSN